MSCVEKLKRSYSLCHVTKRLKGARSWTADGDAVKKGKNSEPKVCCLKQTNKTINLRKHLSVFTYGGEIESIDPAALHTKGCQCLIVQSLIFDCLN